MFKKHTLQHAEVTVGMVTSAKFAGMVGPSWRQCRQGRSGICGIATFFFCAGSIQAAGMLDRISI